MLRILGAATLGLVGISGSATASWVEITSCSSLSGMAYYLPGPLVPADKAGWQEDAISKGSTTLLSDGKNFDIVFKDAAGRQRSVRFHEKAIVKSRINTHLTVMVTYPKGNQRSGVSSEQYTFRLSRKGDGIMILSQQRDALISKVSVMAGACKAK